MAPRFAIDIHADASDLLDMPVDFASTGDNIIVAGVADQVIRVWKLWFLCSAATNITFKEATINKSGAAPFSTNEGMVLDFDTKPWVTCASGDSFVLNQSGTAQVSGMVYYTRV